MTRHETPARLSPVFYNTIAVLVSPLGPPKPPPSPCDDDPLVFRTARPPVAPQHNIEPIFLLGLPSFALLSYRLSISAPLRPVRE